MLNTLETVFLMYALNKIGAIANLISPFDSERELKSHICDVNSSIIFILDIFIDNIDPILESTNVETVIVCNLTEAMGTLTRIGARLLKGLAPKELPKNNKYVKWASFIKKGEAFTENNNSVVSREYDAPAVICYTGGTTGGSKGVVLTNKSIITVAQQYIWRGEEISRQSKWLQILPLFIAYGVTCSLQIPLMVGMRMIIRITGTETIAELCKHTPQYIVYSPVFWEKFADDNKDIDLSFLKECISGGDTLVPAVEDKVNNYLASHGCTTPILNGYGMSEVGAAVSVNHKKAYEYGSVGIPFIMNTISAFDVDTGEELPIGTEGEICINTPSVMKEYWNNEKETFNIIREHKDGKKWVHTGDLGYISENGFVHISGRLKRYILTKYNNLYKKVFSLDIEKVLLKHPAVSNCVVVPIPDEVREQVPKAVIILKDESVDSHIIEQNLRDYCDKELDELYKPVKYEFVKEYPLTRIGKVDYRALSEI